MTIDGFDARAEIQVVDRRYEAFSLDRRGGILRYGRRQLLPPATRAVRRLLRWPQAAFG